MHIIEIVLDGFKSYATRTEIKGFDPAFNAITGLNGSGKSNVLDSICFVLGISNLSQVRAQNLNELIYKQGQAGVTKASVTLVFDNSDRSLAPLGYEQYQQITVTRQVAVGGRNKYLINGHTAQLQRVQNLFHSVQLNVNNPHFLIMQGRITKVLNMKPPEILSMLEEAAGTRMFEVKRQQAVKTIEKKGTKLEEINRVINEDITPRLEKLDSERAQYAQYTSLSSGVDELNRFCKAYDYHASEQARDKIVTASEEDTQRQSELTDVVSRADSEQAELKQNLADVLAKREKEGGSEVKKLQAREAELSKQLVKVSAECEQLKQMLDAGKEGIESLDTQVEEMAQSKCKLVADLKKAVEQADKARNAHAEVAEALKLSQSQYEADMGMGSGDGAKNLQGQLSEADAAVKVAETALKAAEMKLKHLNKEAKETDKKLAAARKSGGEQEKDASALRQAISALEQKLQRLHFDDEKEEVLSKRCKALYDQTSQLRMQEDSIAASTSGLVFKYCDPEPGFDRGRVMGTVASNLKVRDLKNATALEALAGGKLHQVIVDNEKTGMLLFNRGRLQRRVTLIPLSKIQANRPDARTLDAARKLVGDRASAAIDLVDFSSEVTSAMCHVFQTGMVCTDKDAARVLCEQLRLKTVTLDGDLYDPQGTLTGGSRKKGDASILSRVSQLRELRDTLAAQEAELAQAQKELDSQRAASDRAHQLRSELELKQQELQLHEQALANSTVGQLSGELDVLRKQMVDITEASARAKDDLHAETQRRDHLKSEVADSEGNHEARLAKLKAAVAAAEKQHKSSSKTLQTTQQVEQTLQLKLDDLDKQTEAAAEQKQELKQRQEEQAALVDAKGSAEAQTKADLDEASETLRLRLDALGTYDNQRAEIEAKRDELDRQRADAQVELKQIEHRCARSSKEKASIEACIASILEQHPWIEAERDTFGVAGGKYDFKKRKPAAAQKELAKNIATLESLGKRINKKVLSMFEKAEQEYKDLMSKKETVEKDKEKIEAVIAELEEKKIEALQKTWAKVNSDFGSIFSTLLPGTDAKLEPQEGRPVEEGLIVKVAFGSVWKQSLLELSGGQRSLVALSLVLSLLRFKPAPVYILDEIDAALDLSHTQNIGAMIKTHFHQSQFLVVSLKEGMFNNANVLFKTKFVDGVSTITRTVPAGAAAREKEAAKAKSNANGMGRKALNVIN
mmetsp:Transcript_7154/g.12012  ORF Transcript_7154/g.12012 Transcript_7154/m.12012 type:complete len:1198 (-) Transcript_7154:278-3871(-)